jgi:hypothetical protein
MEEAYLGLSTSSLCIHIGIAALELLRPLTELVLSLKGLLVDKVLYVSRRYGCRVIGVSLGGKLCTDSDSERKFQVPSA